MVPDGRCSGATGLWLSGLVLVGVLVSALVTTPAFSQQPASSYDEIRREIAALSERVDKLEAENAALKDRNDKLEKLVTAQAPPAAPVAAQSAAAPVIAAAAKPVAAPAPEAFRVSGYLLADAYGVLANHNPAVAGQSGFWVRRGYLTFDGRISDAWSSRLRFEVNSPGDFTTNAKLTPFVKDAFLAWKSAGNELDLGISPSPTWDFVEGFWGYRIIEKTPLDLYRMGSARDFGVAYHGKALDGRTFYHGMFGNGAAEGSETNQGKKGMFSFGFRPTDALVVELYGDYEDRPGNTDRTTYHAFAGWKGTRSRYGLEYGHQHRDADTGPGEAVSFGSLFGVWGLTAKSTLIARWDRSFAGFSDAEKIPYIPIANNTEFDLAVLGWDYKLLRQISLIPNLEYVRYRATDGLPAPDDDLYGRLTLYYQF